MLTLLHGQKKHSRHGFSLMEAVIVLGLVGSVVGGLWRVSSSSTAHSQGVQVMRGVNVIAGNVQRMLRPYRTTVNQMDASNDAFFAGADGFTKVGSQRLDPFGHPVTLTHSNTVYWKLSLTSLDSAQCIKTLTGLSNTSDSSGLFQVTVGSGSPMSPPFSVADATSNCGTQSANVSFMFTLFPGMVPVQAAVHTDPIEDPSLPTF